MTWLAYHSSGRFVQGSVAFFPVVVTPVSAKAQTHSSFFRKSSPSLELLWSEHRPVVHDSLVGMGLGHLGVELDAVMVASLV